jgi:hypothetical protein
MRVRKILIAAGMLAVSAAGARAAVSASQGSETQLTIYNDNFASVKERRTLDLKRGENEVQISGMTSQLEPDSVVLRDLKNPSALRILEQDYEANPLSQGHMLQTAEGQVLDFEVVNPQTNEKRILKAKIIRAASSNPGGYQYGAPAGTGEPIVEVDGKISFGLPGKPLFDALDPKAFLKPTLLWKLEAESGGQHEIEVAYLTGGFKWEASYNFVADKGDAFDVLGWVTLENLSGKDFEEARVKLVAGDVHRVVQGQNYPRAYAAKAMAAEAPPVTERSFEEYHLYTLPRPTALRDRETKQVEFLRASNVPAKRIYVYDGRAPNQYGYQPRIASAGTESNPDVGVVLEVVNSEHNGLGIPLPKGKVKLYRRDIDGRNEFVGEDEIRHTPKDETLRLNMGNAFDITGERRQTNFTEGRPPDRNTATESFEIKLRNHKKESIEVRVVEHLWRSHEWEISENSHDYKKIDASTIEFRVPVKPDGESAVTYTVRYRW